MNRIHLFPTLICCENYQDAQTFKELIFDTIYDHLTEDGYSDELTGHLTLQLDNRYAGFYKFVTKSAMEYVACLDIDPNIYDYNIVKSWFNITKKRNNPVHSHADAHLSFVYYINTPDTAKKMLCFFSKHCPNELYSGMYHRVQGHNLENSTSWSLEVNEGEIYLFPANLHHGVLASRGDIKYGEIQNADDKDQPIRKLKKFRAAIAGDIVLTHKDKAAVSMGLQPIKNWRTF